MMGVFFLWTGFNNFYTEDPENKIITLMYF